MFKKYGKSYLRNYLKLNQNKDGSRKLSIGFTKKSRHNLHRLTIPRLYDHNTPIVWADLVPNNDLLNSSFFNNITPYLKKAANNNHFKNNLNNVLSQNQEKLYLIYKQKLINWPNTFYFNSSDKFIHELIENNYNLYKMPTNTYYSQKNLTLTNYNLRHNFLNNKNA